MRIRYRLDIDDLGVHEWKEADGKDDPPTTWLCIPWMDRELRIREVRLRLLAVEHGVAVYA